MFPQNKITHLNKMQYIYYLCSPALKCLPAEAAGKHGHLKGSAACSARQRARPDVVPGLQSQCRRHQLNLYDS